MNEFLALMKKAVSKNETFIAFAMFIIAGVAVACYSRSLPSPYVYDDKAVLRDVLAFNDPSGWHDVFSRKYFTIFGERTYRPVLTLSFFVDSELWKLNPRGAHAVSIALHIFTAWLIFAILIRLIVNPYAALFGALVFAAHPLNVEAVALASNREELLCGLFYFCSFYLYMLWRARQRNTVSFITLSSFCMVLAMFSKEMAATLPAALLLYDLVIKQGNEKTTDTVKKGFPFYIATAASVVFFLVVKFTFMRNDGGAAPLPADTVWLSILTMCRAFFEYIRLLFIPVSLCAEHIIPPARSFFGLYGLCMLGLALFIAIPILIRRRAPLPAFAMLFFFIALLPVSNIIPFGAVLAERYAYLPALSFSIIAAWAFNKINANLIFKSAVCAAIIAALGAGAFLRTAVWSSDLALWGNTIKCAPSSPTAHHNLGNVYAATGKYSDALKQYSIAESCPDAKDLDKISYNRGLALLALGRTNDAKNAFVESIRYNPAFSTPHLNLGSIAEKENNQILARFHYQRAIDKAPYSALPYYIAGRHRLETATSRDDLRDAFLLLSRSIGINPHDANAHAALGITEIRLGNRRGGLEALKTALQIDPNNIPAAKMLSSNRVTSAIPDTVYMLARTHANWIAWLVFFFIFFLAVTCILYVRYLTME